VTSSLRTVRRLAVALAALAATAAVAARPPVVTDIQWEIRREATERSTIMQSLHVLTDLHGPRLTASPALQAAAQWAAGQLTAWGLVHARLEPWEFGHPGWSNERLVAHIVAPVKNRLVAEPLAWTPGTDGPITAPAYHLVPPDRPTEPELRTFLDSVGDAVKGRIVLVGKPRHVPVSFSPSATRLEDAEAARQFDPVAPAPPTARYATPAEPERGRLTPRQIAPIVDAFLLSGGALARIDDAGMEHGKIRAFSNRSYDVGKAVPTIVARNEDFGRIARLLASGYPVTLELDIVNRTWPEGRTQHNVVAEIPGTDRAREVVMLGAHLDAWHAATGATDNAIGVAVVMEVARILKALDIEPRRTIRLALWTGEEQGLLGSKAYVEQHFGSFERPKPAFHDLAAYLNLDSGTGRARGMRVFGPPEAAAVLREALAPLDDLGVVGAAPVSVRRFGSSDHTSFIEAGLPGIGVATDPIEYERTTWHTNLDTYERIIEDDARASAIALAAAVYHLATRDAMLPRFSKEQMPRVAEPRDQPAPERTPTRQPPTTH
jgi:carboxypeptidase Q